jgi:hypothetical protein
VYILPKNSGANDFTKWPDSRRQEIHKDTDAGDKVVGANPDLDGRMITPAERPHRPWLVPGMGRL